MNRQRQQQRDSGQQQPRDAKIISLLLQSHGVHDFDPKVVHQLLEFAHSKYFLLNLNLFDIQIRAWEPDVSS